MNKNGIAARAAAAWKAVVDLLTTKEPRGARHHPWVHAETNPAARRAAVPGARYLAQVDAARAAAEFRRLALDTPRRSRLAQQRAEQQSARRAMLREELAEADVTLTFWADFKAWRGELNQIDE